MTKSVRSDKQSVECVCPLCNETHHLYIFWTGSLPARKFCNQCLGTDEDLDCHSIYFNAEDCPEILDECR